jgi:hypothetical protein
MLYKPKFCCNCGEKIERTDWNLLTSRRFCESCAIENKRYDRLPQATMIVGVLAMMFGLGTLFGGGRSETPSVQTLSSSPAHSRLEASASKPAVKVQVPADMTPDPKTLPPTSATAIPLPTSTAETPAKVHYCGALTKKGTPCSRKVKAAGSRCFQHDGQPAKMPGE